MIRVVLYFVLAGAAATGLAWLADQPGSVSVVWLGYNIRADAFIASIVVIAAFIGVILAGWLGILTWTAPRRFMRRLKARKTRIGNEALRRGIFAAGAGDKAAAMKAGLIAKKVLPDEPLTLLLEAQSAQLNEDAIASRQAFERMLEKPEMAELGLRGLFIEAKKANLQDAAKQFAERALTANPALSWSSAALFEMQCRDGDWRSALKTLGIAKQYRHLGKQEADRRRAIMLTALASEIEDTQQSKALAYALEAYQLLPSLIPAAVIAARLLAAQGSTARALKIVNSAWRTMPHPDLALICAHARTGDAPKDRLQRVKTLVASSAASLEGDIAVAVAAIEAKDWPAARAALQPHLNGVTQTRVYRLMARIEAGQHRDAGRAREWLGKAARAAPDPAWVAADGTVSPDWRATAPASATLGVFDWKSPPMSTPHASDDMIAELRALDAVTIDPDPTIPSRAIDLEPRAASIGNVVENTVSDPSPEAGEEDIAVRLPGRQIAVSDRAPADVSSESVDKAGAVANATGPAQAKMETASGETRPGGSDNTAASPKLAVPTIVPPKKPVTAAPKIFIAGPAPDDPGPPIKDVDDASTPLSRYRAPK